MSKWKGTFPDVEKHLKTELDRKLYELLCEGWKLKGTLWTINELKKLIVDNQPKENK